jgi:hypothetical protein
MCTDADAVACPAVWRWMLPRADDRGLFRALRKTKNRRVPRATAVSSAAFRFVGGGKALATVAAGSHRITRSPSAETSIAQSPRLIDFSLRKGRTDVAPLA